MTRDEARAFLQSALGDLRDGGASFLQTQTWGTLTKPNGEATDLEGQFGNAHFTRLRNAFAALGFGAVPRDYGALPPGATLQSWYDPAQVAALDRNWLDLWVIWAGRGERFCTGFDADLIRSGLYAVAAERALALTDQ